MSEKQRYINPSKHRVIDWWPIGGARRGKATFKIEEGSRGQRCVRTTEFEGHVSKPKTTTYGPKAWLVEGADDGKLYIVTDNIWSLYVMQSNLKYAAEHIDKADPRYAEMVKDYADMLAKTANTPA